MKQKYNIGPKYTLREKVADAVGFIVWLCVQIPLWLLIVHVLDNVSQEPRDTAGGAAMFALAYAALTGGVGMWVADYIKWGKWDGKKQDTH